MCKLKINKIHKEHSTCQQATVLGCFIISPNIPMWILWEVRSAEQPYLLRFTPRWHWHGWDQVKVWILKGEKSHSKCILKPFFVAYWDTWILKSSCGLNSPIHALIYDPSTVWRTDLFTLWMSQLYKGSKMFIHACFLPSSPQPPTDIQHMNKIF